ncbi:MULTISPECIES: toxic anion resistance protein [Mammaliicoccus]|uniref:Toxic anion resistance protein n=1 Tax=Mammaliicoccus vitulinus TaxID=71237 RepID=A0A2T4PUI1_9STAP|nr:MULTISPECIES: toxic anion resistance protein [Mammaliicoccus]HAL09262.1 toxic anion resistance protein [Staphylococcus sp.]MBM6630294.1 toxic anion resistance protein [Mammaliicoccus vitulinus]MBO3077068.1 toxic anion resistance protein [Mammaliicoccus vitulinus]MEB7656735.1 toxic anion resistance protein [Mammaliicoccus vitulinus]PNZ40834.1 toxic anion resistance protein [Mammaliicoccus vitulinus]
MTETNKNLFDDLIDDPFKDSSNELAAQKSEVTEQQTKSDVTSTYEKSFSDEDQRKINEIAKQIKPLDNDGLLLYGQQAQSKLSQFSHQMLTQVQSKDVGPIGSSLRNLMNKLKEVNPDELQKQNKSRLKRIFRRAERSVNEMFSKYQSVGAQVDRISVELQKSQNMLMKDVGLLDQLYEENKAYFDALNIYIAAAEKKRDELKQNDLVELENKVKSSNNQMDVQELADLQQYINRLEKRIYDLQLSRQITLQSAPQIRMIQNINQTLAEKIQSSILTSIPLWKNQMAIALTLLRQQGASEAQKKVTDTTNELLLKNSEMLKQNAVRTAEENERGIVDIETLKTTQTNIVDTIQETLRIQEDGTRKRQQAEQELQTLEQDLKTKLLQLKDEQHQLRNTFKS